MTCKRDRATRVHTLITEDIPNRVAANTGYQNARKNPDKQNACIEYDKALQCVMTAALVALRAAKVMVTTSQEE